MRILRLLTLTALICTLFTSCAVFSISDDTSTISNNVISNNKTESGDTAAMNSYDFTNFKKVNLINADISSMTEEELSVLYAQAKYCQAMTDADIEAMRSLVSEDKTYTHMSGMQQTMEEYFADVKNGRQRYYTIGIDTPKIEVDGDIASITYTSVLNANAYGSRGTYRMNGTHWYEKQNGEWILINDPNS